MGNKHCKRVRGVWGVMTEERDSEESKWGNQDGQ